MDRADVQAAWHTMSRSYGWSLAHDEAALIDRALSECHELGVAGSSGARIAVWRVYGALLYGQLRLGENQAAQELWRMFAYTAMSWGTQREAAEELAQETMLRVLLRLPTITSPAGFLTWALRVLRTVQHTRRAAEPAEPLPDTPDQHDLPGQGDFTQVVEQRLVAADIAAQLRARLHNELEQTALLRAVIDGDTPRDIAADLSLPAYRIRVAKSRAVQQLRNDPALRAWLSALAGDETRALGETGASNNDE